MIDYDLFTQHYHIDINTELLQKHKVHYLHCNNDLYKKIFGTAATTVTKIRNKINVF